MELNIEDYKKAEKINARIKHISEKAAEIINPLYDDFKWEWSLYNGDIILELQVKEEINTACNCHPEFETETQYHSLSIPLQELGPEYWDEEYWDENDLNITPLPCLDKLKEDIAEKTS